MDGVVVVRFAGGFFGVRKKGEHSIGEWAM